MSFIVFANGDTWEKVLQDKGGKVEFYWYPNNIVIENSLDIIDGVEHDLASAFIEYLNAKYTLDIEMQWIETESFSEVLQIITNGSGGTFGSSSISITDERKKRFNFTPTYLADVAVMITNSSFPIALTEDELKRILNGSTAVSITNTTLATSLEMLRENLQIEFEIEYVRNSGNIVERIGKRPNSFGYIDIANFLVAIERNTSVRRQFYLVEDTNNKLRALNDEKNNLIQVLAHDLRSPLSNILNGAQIIEANEKLSDQGKTLLGFILQSSDKMRSLIDKILDVDAIETGKHNIKLEKLSLEGVVDQVLKDNDSKARGKSITLAKNLADGLYVLADKIYMAQILDNLVSNAIKYSKESSTIEISTSINGDMTRISIADQGPGLTKEDKKKLFMKYQKLSAKPSKGEESIGLGLSIVKLFTERMGGMVSYDTKLGEGTTFHIDLQG